MIDAHGLNSRETVTNVINSICDLCHITDGKIISYVRICFMMRDINDVVAKVLRAIVTTEEMYKENCNLIYLLDR